MLEFAPSSHPMVPETPRTAKMGSPIGALSQKVQVVEAIVKVRLGHARIICLPRRLHRDKKRLDVSATRPESSGELAVNSPPQVRRGGAPSAGVVLNVGLREPSVPQIHNGLM
jgi:hypothetical protein